MGEIINTIVTIVTIFIYIAAIIVISIGIIKAFYIFIVDIFSKKEARKAIKESRLEIGHSFTLGLSFLIGGSILKTTIAPTWNDIGQLASIIAIRTILNYFLIRDVEQLQEKE
ncbi:MAG: DUF1622 domain-containing protein [Candidatus Cloacimonetes bacterium]|nr:DUF1622 domain-containing protein [Candidatus Cloacimonadota bacterium]